MTAALGCGGSVPFFAPDMGVTQTKAETMTHDKTTKPSTTNAKRQREHLELQVLEYIERYHPEFGNVSVEISPKNTSAIVRSKPR
jgi:hypothetical protein